MQDRQAEASAMQRFFLGLGLLLALFYYSALRQQHVAGYEYAVLVCAAVAVLVLEYHMAARFLARVAIQERATGSHDRAVRLALADTLKPAWLARLIGTELLTLYYAFIARHDASVPARNDRLFSYAGSSNARDVFLIVAFSQLPFVPFLHVFIEHRKGPGPAWIITLITLWSVVWYLAQVEAVKCRPIELGRKKLQYRFGLFWTAEIPLEHIRAARSIEASEELGGRDLFLSPFGSSRNVMLEFDRPIEFKGPYGFRRREHRAAISLDKPALFLDRLAARGITIS